MYYDYNLRTGEHRYFVHDDNGVSCVAYAEQDGPGPTYWIRKDVSQNDCGVWKVVPKTRREITRDEYLRITSLPVVD